MEKKLQQICPTDTMLKIAKLAELNINIESTFLNAETLKML